MEWYESLDLFDNPFTVSAFESEYPLRGRQKEQEEILYHIAAGSMLVVQGVTGSGKTALLKHAIDHFQGEGKVIYLNGNKLNKTLNVAKLIHKKPKGMILLFDNVQELSRKNNERIKYFYDEDYIHAVVFTTSDVKKTQLSPSLLQRIGKNVLTLNSVDSSHTSSMVKDRLGQEKILPVEVIKKIHTQSSSVGDFLKRCDAICSSVIEQGKHKATIKDVDSYAQSDISSSTKDDRFHCPECDEPLIEIKEQWRCPECDEYCRKCGSLYEEEDEKCGECGVKRDD